MSNLTVTPNPNNDPYFQQRLQATSDAAAIRDNAGCLLGEPPGFSADVTHGYTNATVYFDTDASNLLGQMATINSRADIDAYVASGLASGTGTKDDPYLLNGFKWIGWHYNSDITENYCIDWNDPTADYHLKVSESYFNNSRLACIRVNIRPMTDPLHTTFTLDHCISLTDGNATAKPVVLLESGKAIITVHEMRRSYSALCEINTGSSTGGDACRAEVLDLWHNQSTGSNAPATVIRFSSSDTTALIDRATIDMEANTPIIVVDRSPKDVQLRNISWHPNRDLGAGNFYLSEYTKPHDIVQNIHAYNCRMAAGSASSILNTYNNDRTRSKNISFVHCEFIAAAIKTDSYRTILFGTPNDLEEDSVNGLLLSHCAFYNEDDVRTGPGNETIMIMGAIDVTIEYCWVFGSCDEAYELYACKRGIHVHHCGGSPHPVTGTAMKGQMVDIYAQDDANSLGGYYIHHIYGECGPGAVGDLSEVISITSQGNIVIHDIYVDNSASAIGYSITVTDHKSVGGPLPDNIQIYGPLPLNASCSAGKQIEIVAPVGANVNASYYDEFGNLQTIGTPDTIPVR